MYIQKVGLIYLYNSNSVGHILDGLKHTIFNNVRVILITTKSNNIDTYNVIYFIIYCCLSFVIITN